MVPIGVLVKAKITSIRMLFIIKSTYLNVSTFNGEINYHIIPDFGPIVGYLRRFFFEIRGIKYHNILMIRDRMELI